MQRFKVHFDVTFQLVESPPRALAQFRGILQQRLLKPKESLLVVAHLRSENDVADLVNVATFGRIWGRGGLGLPLGLFGCHRFRAPYWRAIRLARDWAAFRGHHGGPDLLLHLGAFFRGFRGCLFH